MTNIRLLPIVIMAIAALFVLKTLGLVTNGGYVLTGVASAQAAGGGAAAASPVIADEAVTLPSNPVLSDQTPTLADTTPTLSQAVSGAADHGVASTGQDQESAAEAPVPGAGNMIAAENECYPRPVSPAGAEDASDGQLMMIGPDCPPLVDAQPQLVTPEGLVPLAASAHTTTEQALLDRLAARRSELESYEQQLAMRASLVEAAEKRIEERQAVMQSIEDQIAALVEQRKQMEEGQFAGIVAMYETMRPKDAAKIFDELDIEVLVRVSKMMSPRKMAPILAAMNTARAQELTVRLASADADPLESMTPDDLAALPQIVGQ